MTGNSFRMLMSVVGGAEAPCTGRQRRFCVPSGCRILADMSADDLPVPAVLTRPDSRVPVRAAHERTGHLDHEPSAKCNHGEVRPDASHTQFLGRVCAEANKPGDVRVEIVRLGPKAAIGPGNRSPSAMGSSSTATFPACVPLVPRRHGVSPTGNPLPFQRL